MSVPNNLQNTHVEEKIKEKNYPESSRKNTLLLALPLVIDMSRRRS